MINNQLLPTIVGNLMITSIGTMLITLTSVDYRYIYI
jgi:hypothetical protein